MDQFDKMVEQITTRKTALLYVPQGNFLKYKDFLVEIITHNEDYLFNNDLIHTKRLKMEYTPKNDLEEITVEGVYYLRRNQTELLPIVEIIIFIPLEYYLSEKTKYENNEDVSITNFVIGLHNASSQLVDATYKQYGLNAHPVLEGSVQITKFY